MAWDYSGFSGEQVERGARLLAESEEYAGSADLQLVVEDKRLVERLLRTLLEPGGRQPRRGLSAREKQQGVALFLHSVLIKLQLPMREALNTVHSAPLLEALREAMSSLQGQGSSHAEWWLGSQAAMCLNALSFSPDTQPDAFATILRNMLGHEWGAHEEAVACRALEAHMRAERLEPVLTAAQQQQLYLLLLPYAARKLMEGPEPLVAAQAPAAWRAAEKACRQLLAMAPDSAALRMTSCPTFEGAVSPAQGLAAYRAALDAANASKAHWFAAQAASCVLRLLLHGAGGPEWDLPRLGSCCSAPGKASSSPAPGCGHT